MVAVKTTAATFPMSEAQNTVQATATAARSERQGSARYDRRRGLTSSAWRVGGGGAVSGLGQSAAARMKSRQGTVRFSGIVETWPRRTNLAPSPRRRGGGGSYERDVFHEVVVCDFFISD